MTEFKRMIVRALEPIVSRLQMMITKVIVDSVQDSKNIQLVKISGLEGEVMDNVERLQNYGFTSNPPKDSEGLIVCIGGNKDHPVLIAVDNGTSRKMGLSTGEVAFYQANGSFVILKNNGDIQLVPKSGKIDIVGDTVSSGDVIDKNGSLDDLRTQFNSFADPTSGHIHTTPSGPSGPPVASPPTP